MTARDEKLSTDFAEAAALAVSEHLSTLKMEMPDEEIEVVSKNTGECITTQNPLWIKVKTLKNKAASDILRMMTVIDPQSMKGRKTDRTMAILRGIKEWSGPNGKPQ